MRGIANVFQEVKTDASKYSTECIIEKLIKNGLSGKDALKLFNIFRETKGLPPVTLVRYASEIITRKNKEAIEDFNKTVREAKPYPGSQLEEVWKRVRPFLI